MAIAKSTSNIPVTSKKTQDVIFIDTDDVRKHSFIAMTISLSLERCVRCLTLIRPVPIHD